MYTHLVKHIHMCIDLQDLMASYTKLTHSPVSLQPSGHIPTGKTTLLSSRSPSNVCCLALIIIVIIKWKFLPYRKANCQTKHRPTDYANWQIKHVHACVILLSLIHCTTMQSWFYCVNYLSRSDCTIFSETCSYTNGVWFHYTSAHYESATPRRPCVRASVH